MFLANAVGGLLSLHSGPARSNVLICSLPALLRLCVLLRMVGLAHRGVWVGQHRCCPAALGPSRPRPGHHRHHSYTCSQVSGKVPESDAQLRHPARMPWRCIKGTARGPPNPMALRRPLMQYISRPWGAWRRVPRIRTSSSLGGDGDKSGSDWTAQGGELNYCCLR